MRVMQAFDTMLDIIEDAYVQSVLLQICSFFIVLHTRDPKFSSRLQATIQRPDVRYTLSNPLQGPLD